MGEADWFAQSGARCRLDWGRDGARRAAVRGDVLVVVDALRFSSTVATIVARGGLVYPCAWEDDPVALARRVGAAFDPERRGAALSPIAYADLAPGTAVVLASPNGATCSQFGRDVPALFAGAFVNARAVAQAVETVLETTFGSVTVLACGERWTEPGEDGPLRFALEDFLAAGAIVSHLTGTKSPEARATQAASDGVAVDLATVLWECGSGRELQEKGFGEDVRHAARLDLYDSAPLLRGERFERFR